MKPCEMRDMTNTGRNYKLQKPSARQKTRLRAEQHVFQLVPLALDQALAVQVWNLDVCQVVGSTAEAEGQRASKEQATIISTCTHSLLLREEGSSWPVERFIVSGLEVCLGTVLKVDSGRSSVCFLKNARCIHDECSIIPKA